MSKDERWCLYYGHSYCVLQADPTERWTPPLVLGGEFFVDRQNKKKVAFPEEDREASKDPPESHPLSAPLGQQDT